MVGCDHGQDTDKRPEPDHGTGQPGPANAVAAHALATVSCGAGMDHFMRLLFADHDFGQAKGDRAAADALATQCQSLFSSGSSPPSQALRKARSARSMTEASACSAFSTCHRPQSAHALLGCVSSAPSNAVLAP